MEGTDGQVLLILGRLDDYLNRKHDLELYLRKGYMEIASARYQSGKIRSHEHPFALSQSSEQQATFKVNVESSGIILKTESTRYNTLTNRFASTSLSNSPSMSSQKTAQKCTKHFSRCLELCIEIANLKRMILENCLELERMLKL